ncbi:MAG: serine/threonine protein kinase [Alphaproteobacteria bacterium]|nr:serine/threonine protein kinase [Alphaproteobacteria bacterium]
MLDTLTALLARHGVVRLSGPGATGLATAWARGRPTVAEVSVGEVPREGAAWLHDDPGARVAADIWAGARALLHHPVELVLTGLARDGGHPTVGVDLEVQDAGPEDLAARTRVVVRAAPEDLPRLAEEGDIVGAHALWETLGRPVGFAWLELYRLARGGRGMEVEERAPELAAAEPSRLLLHMAIALFGENELERAASYALAALRRTHDDGVRADTAYVLARIRERDHHVVVPPPHSTFLRAFAGWSPTLRHLLHGLPGELAALSRAQVECAPQDPAGWLSIGHQRSAAFARLATHPVQLDALRYAAEGERTVELARGLEAYEQGDLQGLRARLSAHDVYLRASTSTCGHFWVTLSGHLAATEARVADTAWFAGRLRHGFPRFRIHPRVAAAFRPSGHSPAHLWCAVSWIDAMAQALQTPEAVLTHLDRLPATPIVLGDYMLHDVLATGGNGTVWRGEHVLTGTPVAVKVLRDAPSASVDAFRREIEVVAGFDHPAIVTVLDVLDVSPTAARQSRGALPVGQPALVMEHVPGGTLADLQGEVPWSALRDVLLALLDALAYAHAHGVLHRDLKPQNVLLDGRGGIRLSDFGVSALDPARRSGTPAFMAPEQFQGGRLTPATDLYALGCLTWALLTGVPPYLGSVTQLAAAHTTAPLPPLAVTGSLPVGLEAWLRRCLAKDPARRFASAAEAADSLASGDEPAEPLRLGALARSATTFALDTLLDLPAAPRTAADDTATATQVLRDIFEDRASWRPRTPTHLLLHHGDPPILFQREAQEALWAAMMRVVAGKAEAVALVGRPGSGKRSLLRWLRRRARMAGLRVLDVPTPGRMCVFEGEPDTSPGKRERWLRVDVDGEVGTPVHLRDLTTAEVWWILRSRLLLGPALAAHAATASIGIPALALHLVEDWLELPGSRMTPGGLEALRDPSEPSPAGVAYWRDVLGSLAPADLRFAVALAVLGEGRAPVVEVIRNAFGARAPATSFTGASGDGWTTPLELRRAARDALGPDAQTDLHHQLSALHPDPFDRTVHRAAAERTLEATLELVASVIARPHRDPPVHLLEVLLNEHLLQHPLARGICRVERLPFELLLAHARTGDPTAPWAIARLARRSVVPDPAVLAVAREAARDPALPVGVRRSLVDYLVLAGSSDDLPGLAGKLGGEPVWTAWIEGRCLPPPERLAALAPLRAEDPALADVLACEVGDLLLQEGAWEVALAAMEGRGGPAQEALVYNRMVALLGLRRDDEAVVIAAELATRALAAHSRVLAPGALAVRLVMLAESDERLFSGIAEATGGVPDPMLRAILAERVEARPPGTRTARLRALLAQGAAGPPK